MDMQADQEQDVRSEVQAGKTGVERVGSIEQELFEDADEDMLAAPDPLGSSQAESLSQIASKLDDCYVKLMDLVEAVRDRQGEEEVSRKMQQSYQALLERFHERELLQPLFLQLISIADRCREKIGKMEGYLSSHTAAKDSEKYELVRYLAKARRADLVEIENILANFGVSPFEHPAESFDPSVQSCVARSLAAQPERAGKIARRLRPGYRRNAQVIRPECVAVYVLDSTDPD